MEAEIRKRMTPFARLRALLRVDIHDESELTDYVMRVTALCVVVAVGLDVVNQLTFFDGWTPTLRSWLATSLIATAIAAPISRAIGKAHLELYRAKQAVDKISRTDPLTGLANRRALIEAAEARALSALVLVIFDIDRFKRVNDTYGHMAGDQVIVAVSQAMTADLGHLGTVCRLGGEEFALLASDVPTENVLDGVWAFCEHLAANPIHVSGATVSVTVSAGVASCEAGAGFDEIYASADRALYAAKAAGRNRVSFSGAASEPAQSHPGERRRWRIADEEIPQQPRGQAAAGGS